MTIQELQQYADNITRQLHIPFVQVSEVAFGSIDEGQSIGCYGQDGIEVDLHMIQTLPNPNTEAYLTVAHEVAHAYQEHFGFPMNCDQADVFAGLYVLAMDPEAAVYSLPPVPAASKILVLDVDGVINTNRSMLACGRTPSSNNYRLHELDMVGIGLLRHLCRLSGAKILLSSTWGEGMSSYDLSLFRSTLCLPIIDKIPLEPDDRWGRVQAWLRRNPEVSSIVILDDEAFTFPKQLLVQCREEDGITENIAKQLAAHLGVELYTRHPDDEKPSVPTFTAASCLEPV